MPRPTKTRRPRPKCHFKGRCYYKTIRNECMFNGDCSCRGDNYSRIKSVIEAYKEWLKVM